MNDKVTMLPDQPVAQLTVSQLEMLVTAIVRRVVREELRRRIIIDDIAQHDAAYDRINKL